MDVRDTKIDIQISTADPQMQVKLAAGVLTILDRFTYDWPAVSQHRPVRFDLWCQPFIFILASSVVECRYISQQYALGREWKSINKLSPYGPNQLPQVHMRNV